MLLVLVDDMSFSQVLNAVIGAAAAAVITNTVETVDVLIMFLCARVLGEVTGHPRGLRGLESDPNKYPL